MSTLIWQFGGDTDIGGSKENQDDMFVFEKKDKKICILCVLDGHGRDVGRTASNAGRKFMLEFFESKVDSLKLNPYETLVESFKGAHAYIKEAFRLRLAEQGFEVQEALEGYLLKRKRGATSWTCVHGGTSCSLLALIDQKLYVVNVGDSSGILCSPASNLNLSALQHLGDAALEDLKAKGTGTAVTSTSIITPPSTVSPSPSLTPSNSIDANTISDTLVLTAEHSPEAVSEFLRLRSTRCSSINPLYPEIQILYDSPTHDKSQCPPVFELNASGVPIVTGRGKYYKNVRQEWASLVSTPSSARFQDALAFTRSLGDFHLHTYGVSNLPEIQVIDIGAIIEKMGSLPVDTTGGNRLISIVLASDGVWDNFAYTDVTKFVMDPSCIAALKQDTQGAQRVATSFMQRNMTRSRSNFGSQADNATVIVMYLSISTVPAFPTDGFGVRY
eukprot:gene10509-21918_t